MPGEQPRGVPSPAMTGGLQPCQTASGMASGTAPQPPREDSALASRNTKATGEAGSGTQALEPPDAQPQQTREVEPKASHPGTQTLISAPGKGCSPRAPPGRNHTQTPTQHTGRADDSPQQLYSLSVARARPPLDETPEGPQREATRPPEAEGPPAPEEISFQRCFQETPSSFTSTNYTSPSATPGPPPLRAPQSSDASPCRPASYSELQASGADAWPPTAENSFPGASFGVPPAEPEPFPEGGSPRVASFQFPFPALHRAGPKSFPEDTAGPEYSERALVFSFHQPRGAWPEEAVGTGTAYPLPARPAPRPPPCYPSQPRGLNPHSDLGRALPSPGAAHLAPSPFSESTATFPDNLHKSLTKALPERPPSAHNGLGSPRGPPNSLPQRHFPGQVYGSPRASGVGTSPGSLDTELATPGPPPTRLPQLWDPTAAPYPTPPLGPPAAARSTFFEGQLSPGQRLGLPQSPPLPWPQVLPATGPSPHPVEMLSQLPFPPGASEWQGGSQRTLGAASKTPGPGEKLTVLRDSPGQHSSGSPGLFAYNGMQEPGAQPLFFGVAQPQVSPRGTPGLPPPRLVGASPTESPLPSPATNTAGSSTCSSLSPLSSSPANPSSEESQLPGSLGPSTFFHPPTHPQETSSPFPSPKPSHALPIHYQPEPVKDFPFPTEGLGAEGAFKCLEEAPFPSTGPEVGSGGLEGFPPEPPPYSAHHFPLSSASLDQLDVLLTCKQCDRNYSSLAAFLEHRQFCSLLLARTKEGHRQPSGLPTPPTTPSVLASPKAPASGNPSLLSHTKTVPFLLAGDVRVDSKDDPLKTSFLPGLAAASFPLPASDLDLEDDAKLDSLITEALNGLEYQSDNPEIDSSFIDVFADEEPSGPRGPSAGQPPKTKVGATPENKAQFSLPAVAAPLEPQVPHPGDRSYPACNRPKTRSLGPVPAEADGVSLASQQRRGKQIKFFRKELDTANTAKRSGRSTRATCLRPRRKGDRAEPAPPHSRGLRTQAPKGHTDLGGRVLPVETRSSKRLQLSPGMDSRRRKARGGTWSKELIHKIVLQKNQLHRRRARRGQGGRGSLATQRPEPSTLDGGLQGYDYASESEDEDGLQPRGSSFRSQPRPSCRRWHQGEKRKEVDLTPGPREDREQQTSSKVVRQETTQPGRPCPGATESPEARAGPKKRGPQHLLQVLTKTPQENHPSLDLPQETKNPDIAGEFPPATTELLRDISSSPLATCMVESPCPPASEQPQPGREDTVVPHRSSPAPGAGSALGVTQCLEPPISHEEDPTAYVPGELLVPVTSTTAAYPEPSTLFLKTPDLGRDPALFNEDSMVLATKKGAQPYSSPHSKLLLGPKDLAGCFREDLYSKPLAPETPPASSVHLRQDGADTSPLKPKPPGNPPYTVDTDTGKAGSPLTLQSTRLLSGLPGDCFDPPIYSSLSGNGDTHLPPVCTKPPPRKQQLEPPYPSFLPEKGWCLLEEVSPMLSSHVGHVPDLSEEKAFSKKCLQERTVAASPPPLPGKVRECNITFMSSLSEDELEIKRLVTELESQLQSKGVHEAPGHLCPAEPAGSPLPSHQAAVPCKDTFSAASLTGVGELSPRREGAETAMATTEGTLGSPREEWPSFHPGEAAPPPGTHKDQVSGAPLSPTGASLGFQSVQDPGVSRTGSPKAEEGCRVRPEACLPNPGEPLKPPSERGTVVTCSPNHEPLLPKDNRATRICHSEAIVLPVTCTQRGLFPAPHKAQEPCQDAPKLEGLNSPGAHLAPDLAFQGAGVLGLGATPPSGASHSDAHRGHSLSSTGGPVEVGPLHPLAGGLASVGNQGCVPAGASPNPACMPDASPGKRPQDRATSPLCQLQLLVTRAAESEGDTRDLQGPPSADTQSPQQSDPSELEGDSLEGGNVPCSPDNGSHGGVQTTAVPVVAGCQLGPETDGHLGSLGQAEKLKDPGKASQLQPDDWGVPGGPDNLTTLNANPETALGSPPRASDQLGGQLRGRRAALGPQNKVPATTTSPTSSDVEPLVPPFAAAHSQNGPEAWTPEEVASPGVKKQLLLPGEGPDAPIRDLASYAPLPVVTPVPCSLEHLLQEDPPTVPSGELRGLLQTSPSCGNPTSPKHLPPCSSAWTTPQRADCTPAPTHTRAGGALAAPSSLRTDPCGLKETLAHHPLLGERSPLEDPPLGQLGFINVFTPAQVGDCPQVSMSRTLDGSRKEMPKGSPACDTLLPPVRATSPRVTIRAAALPSIPTTDATGAVRGLRAEWPDPHCRGAPSHTSPNRTPQGPSLEPPGNREDQSITSGPTDPSTQGTTGPEPLACWEAEAGTSSQGQDNLETPGITKISGTGPRGPTVTGPYEELHPGRATSLSSTTSNSRPNNPQNLRNVPYQTPQRDPLCPQDPRQKPCGFKKRLASTENGHWKDRGPVTCEVCLATFRSRPGLSRHRARKHGLHRGAASQPSPPAQAAPQPGEPAAQMCCPPGKKSRRAPGKEKKPRQGLSGPGHAAGSPPIQGSRAPEDVPGPEMSKGLGWGLGILGTPGCPPTQEPHPPGLVKQGVDRKPAEPRKRDRLESSKACPKRAERGGGRRRGRTAAVGESEGKSTKKVRKPRARRFREESSPQVSPDVISDRSPWNPSAAIVSYPAPRSRCCSPEAEPETEVTRPPLLPATDLGEKPSQKSPGHWVAHPGRMEGAPPGLGPKGQKSAMARRCQGPRETGTSGIYREPSQAAKGKPAGDSRAAKGRSEQGVREPPSPPETSGSEAGNTISTCLQDPLNNPEDGVQEHEGGAPEAPGLGLRDPHSLFDDEASFSQLFPLSNRLTRKKNPRVYGKRCKKPKPPPPPPEPSGELQGSATLASPRLPTDLSDSGSLCLSHEDPWGDEAMGLPESFLLEGFLSSKVPGIDPWAPSPSLWALEPDPETDSAEQGPSGSTEDHPSENIPELHMVPAAWRGLELRAPTDETASSLGDVSPEPPNLEREHYDCGLPGNAVDLGRLSAKLEMQDLCFLGHCEDPVGLPGMSFLDFKATENPQGSRRKRTEEAAGARRAPGRDRQAKAGRVPYKCKVCFQRFHGLGELDLHKLAHSPSPPPTCYMCVERRFGSRELLREHLQEKHVQGRAGLWACGMCLREVADVWMYNEHLREHALRFARKGPVRRSLGDPPGCWEEDSTVTHFLSSIMGQTSTPHRGKRSVGLANGGSTEKERTKPKSRASNSNQEDALMTGSALANSSPSTCENPTPPGSSATFPGSTKTCPSPSPDPCSSRAPLLHTIPVHQDCKDPSRDCHHCGKRFPKPFKLQRHLAVHSPQRVFLCPQCPRVYPEPRELRTHLAREHGVREELELQHTPLYTCELCANVTHISKRSFVCSSCNYTFTKKEQFDRHMDKHLRRGQQPFTFRGVRRPGPPGKKAPAREGTLPSKRRRVNTPFSTPEPIMDWPLSLSSSPALSEASLSALLQPCLEAAPSSIKGQPRTPERPKDSVSHLVRNGDLPADPQELLLSSLSPFPAASADCEDGHRPDQAPESPTDEASPGSLGPLLQQAIPLEGSLPQPGARGQAIEERKAAGLFSGKRRTPSTPGKSAPDHCPKAPSLLRKEKQVSMCHMVPEAGSEGPSNKGSATKHGGCRSLSKDRRALSTPTKVPKFPVQSKKAMASPTPGEPACGTEDKQKPTTLKAKLGPSSQGDEGPQHSTKTAGGSQPQPASGQLQSETATTPAKLNCPGQSPIPDKPPTRALAKGHPKAPREAGDQGPQENLGPRENREGKEKKRKGRALGPTRSESVGTLGRAPAVPDKPPRAPRKQATPSRVLPAKPRPSSQNSTMLPQPSEQRKKEPSHSHRDFRCSRDGLSKAFPQARPLHRPPKRGRAVHGAETANPRACWTAESQSDLLSQLFGQRLTSFKIPLKKDPSE